MMKINKSKILLLILIEIVALFVVKLNFVIFFEMVDFAKYLKENFYLTPQQTEEYLTRFEPEKYFDNQKVIEFCKALRVNNWQKADELIKQGVDVNYKGKGGITPALWLLRKTDEGEKKKKAFKYLLDKGIDPVAVYQREKGAEYTVLHIAAEHKDEDYLKSLLNSKSFKKVISILN